MKKPPRKGKKDLVTKLIDDEKLQQIQGGAAVMLQNPAMRNQDINDSPSRGTATAASFEYGDTLDEYSTG